MPPLKSGKRLITLLVQCSAERYVNSLGLIELKFEYCDFVWRLKFPEYLTAVVVIVKYFSGFNVFFVENYNLFSFHWRTGCMDWAWCGAASRWQSSRSVGGVVYSEAVKQCADTSDTPSMHSCLL